jgi:hypothetical protein
MSEKIERLEDENRRLSLSLLTVTEENKGYLFFHFMFWGSLGRLCTAFGNTANEFGTIVKRSIGYFCKFAERRGLMYYGLMLESNLM